MLFQTTSAHEELRAKIRSFAEEEIKPLAFLMDQNNEFPEEAVKKLGKLGWMGIPYPKEYGGAGLDALSYAIAVEELARVDGGTGVILSAHHVTALLVSHRGNLAGLCGGGHRTVISRGERHLCSCTVRPARLLGIDLGRRARSQAGCGAQRRNVSAFSSHPAAPLRKLMALS